MNNKSTTTIVILLLIFFYPVGVPLMFITKTFKRKTRWIIAIFFLVAVIIGLSALIFMTTSPNYIH